MSRREEAESSLRKTCSSRYLVVLQPSQGDLDGKILNSMLAYNFHDSLNSALFLDIQRRLRKSKDPERDDYS